VQQFSHRDTDNETVIGVVKYWALCIIALDVSFTVDQDFQFFTVG
jgi:hypothetical protein